MDKKKITTSEQRTSPKDHKIGNKQDEEKYTKKKEDGKYIKVLKSNEIKGGKVNKE
jgi:hypothetical protein